jgi:hypothetical protein
MGTLGEKAGTFILTAIQVANDTKRMVEERIKGLVKEAMADHEAEIAGLRERVEDLETKVRGKKEPEQKAAEVPARPKKGGAKKKARKRRGPAAKTGAASASLRRKAEPPAAPAVEAPTPAPSTPEEPSPQV